MQAQQACTYYREYIMFSIDELSDLVCLRLALKMMTYFFAIVQAVPATVDGMLGGFGQLSSTDAASSRRFIQPFMQV